MLKKKKIEDVKKNEFYSLFYSFYEESFKIRYIYNDAKSKFNDSKYDEENKKFFDENLKKLEFLYNNIIPSDDLMIKPNTLIIKNLLEIINNTEIGIYEIIRYSQLQSISSQIKLIELNIINNLLLYLNNESNIILILNFICKKIRNKNNILNSVFDNTSGADYYNIEKLKQQFHLFLNIITHKLTNNQNNISIITQISLTESLIWKIRKRNFPILCKMMQVFEELKAEELKDEDYLFSLCSDNIYNVNYFNKKKKLLYKFEIFKILVYQIIKIIIDFLKYKKENEKKLTIIRNPSTLSEMDFKPILETILSFFIEINPNCFYYHDSILFFYKIFINSDILLDYIIQEFPKVINKIMKIIFDNENYDINDKKNMGNNTRMIMIKLLYKIHDNINEDNLECLSKSFENSDNPVVYLNNLYEKILNELNISSDEQMAEKKYSIDLMLNCINMISKFENDDKICKSFINNKLFLNLIEYTDHYRKSSESNFIIKNRNSKK